MSYRVIAGEPVEGENSTKCVNELTRVSSVGRTDTEARLRKLAIAQTRGRRGEGGGQL